MCVLFVIIAAQLTPHGQLDIIKLRFPQKAIPGSVGAVIYLTGESIEARPDLVRTITSFNQ